MLDYGCEAIGALSIIHGVSRQAFLDHQRDGKPNPSGGVEAIISALAVNRNLVPPTINLDDPDEAGEGLDLTPNVAARREMRTAISNSFGFGGQNTALVFRRWDA